MATRTKDVVPGRRATTVSPSASKPSTQVKGNPKASHSSVGGGTTEKGTTTPSVKPLPHYLKSTASSSETSKTNRKNDTSQAQGQSKTIRRSPTLKAAPSAPSTLQSSLPKKSNSASTSPTRSSKLSSPAAPAELGRSSSSKILRPHERHPTNASNNHGKLVSANKTKSAPSSNRGRQISKAGRDSVSVGSQEDHIYDKTMIVEECADPSKYAAGTTMSDGDADVDKDKISAYQQEGHEPSLFEKSLHKAANFEVETKESNTNTKNEDASYTKVKVGGANAGIRVHDDDDVKKEEKAEEGEATSRDETSDHFQNSGQHKPEEKVDNDDVKIEKSRAQSEDLLLSVKGMGGQEDTPRKLNFRKGTILSPKPEDDLNQPRRLSFKNKQVQNDHADDSAKAEDAVVFNQVIEDTASKLVGARKSKVLALAGAFETVISIHETSARNSQGHVNVQSPSAPPPLAAATSRSSDSDSTLECMADPVAESVASPPASIDCMADPVAESVASPPPPPSTDEEVGDDTGISEDNDDANVDNNNE